MLRVIPVLDLLHGRAVHAVAGDRVHYRPVSTRLHPDSDPLGLALAFRDRLGLTELYMADLDSIAGSAPSLGLYDDLMARGFRLWLDVGVRNRSDAMPLLDAGVDRVILGSETLNGPDSIAEILARSDPDRIVFSLDLKGGIPWLANGDDWGTADPKSILETALGLGIRRFLVLDVARVGLGAGVGTEPLISWLRSASEGVEILAGGGVSGRDDLISLENAGADAVLIGSAILDGRIGPADWA